MKKFLFSCLILLMILSSCDSLGYIRDQAVTILGVSNILGCDYSYSHIWSLIAEDKYGRELFAFHPDYNGNIIINQKTESYDYFLISQHIDYENQYIYYYPYDVLLIDCDTTNSTNLYYDRDEVLISTPMKEFKLRNDWNKEVDLTKCIRKKIEFEKDLTYHCFEVESILLNEYSNIENYNLDIRFCDIDKNGLELYAVSLSENEEKYTDVALAILFDINKMSITYIEIEFESDKYIEILEEFKISNNWEYDYYVEN